MRAAVIQMNSGADVNANLAAARGLLEGGAKQGAQLAVLPENFGLMPDNHAQRMAAAEAPGDGAQQAFLAAQSAALGLWIIGGTVPMAAPDGRTYSASFLHTPHGECAARYDKIHLFDVQAGDAERYQESASIAPGQAPLVTDLGGVRAGLTVCYDLRFPELYRVLSGDGAQVLTAPSAFTETTGRAHWDVLIRARAIENLCFMLAPNQCGTHAKGRRTWGHSAITSPWGEVLAMLDNAPGVAIADLDFAEQARRRETFPALNHRRLTPTDPTEPS